jgi:hypothetical protein
MAREAGRSTIRLTNPGSKGLRVASARRVKTQDRGIIVRSGQSVQEVPDGWFSVSISVGVKTVPRSLLT